MRNISFRKKQQQKTNKLENNKPTKVKFASTPMKKSPKEEDTIEKRILRAQIPIEFEEENEEITALNYKGIWLNKRDDLNWNGSIPLNNYNLNDDSDPEIIYKTLNQPVEYTQNISVKFLKPPTPPPNELVIKHSHAPPPPVIIRQKQNERIKTPSPLIIRELPPEPPKVSRKVISVTEPPKRKIIVENLPNDPPKPRPIIIEKWLPYEQNSKQDENKTLTESIIDSLNFPFESNETQEININGQKGVWLNKKDILDWKQQSCINDYKLNDDPNPEIINKTLGIPVEYTQDISVRYLKPPTPPLNEILINEQNNIPPIIIRQNEQQTTKRIDQIIYREKPPPMPTPVPNQIVTIKRNNSEPLKQKVIIEKMPLIPPKPPSIIIEKWLPYEQRKPKIKVVNETRNVIIQWNSPQPIIRRSKFLIIIINFFKRSVIVLEINRLLIK